MSKQGKPIKLVIVGDKDATPKDIRSLIEDTIKCNMYTRDERQMYMENEGSVECRLIHLTITFKKGQVRKRKRPIESP